MRFCKALSCVLTVFLSEEPNQYETRLVITGLNNSNAFYTWDILEECPETLAGIECSCMGFGWGLCLRAYNSDSISSPFATCFCVPFKVINFNGLGLSLLL